MYNLVRFNQIESYKKIYLGDSNEISFGEIYLQDAPKSMKYGPESEPKCYIDVDPEFNFGAVDKYKKVNKKLSKRKEEFL